jgi:hypothetical protein
MHSRFNRAARHRSVLPCGITGAVSGASTVSMSVGRLRREGAWGASCWVCCARLAGVYSLRARRFCSAASALARRRRCACSHTRRQSTMRRSYSGLEGRLPSHERLQDPQLLQGCAAVGITT